MAYLRDLRMLKEWINTDAETEWDDVVRRAAEGCECLKCHTYTNVLYFDFGIRSLFFCIDCVAKIKNEELPPPGSSNSKGLGLRFRVLLRDNFTCVYCGRNPKEDGVKLEVDHIIPKSRGGTDDIDNLVTACWECNQGKKDLLNDTLIKYTKRKQG